MPGDATRRLFVVVNARDDLTPTMTSSRLIHAASRTSFGVRVVALDGVGLAPGGQIELEAAVVPAAGTVEAALAAIVRATAEPCTLSPTDVVLVRINPARFGLPTQHQFLLAVLEQAEARGVRVVNAVRGLRQAGNKALLDIVAPGLSPRQHVVSSLAGAERAVQRLGGQAVLKPVVGTRGRGVLMVDSRLSGVRALAELLLERGPLVVQERIAGASEGDLRVLVVGGQPLEVEGRVVAIRRRPAEGEMRSNLHQGGRAEVGVLGDGERDTVAALGPRLRDLGLSVVGVDLMGGRVLELNAYAPGGVGPFERLTGVDVSLPLLRALVGEC